MTATESQKTMPASDKPPEDAVAHPKQSALTLAIGAVGVVYGDIGTSPLYALRESVAAASGHGGTLERDMVTGVLSLILWSLTLVVTLKYVTILLRADNNGEGGTLTLVALAQRALGRTRGGPVILLGAAGAALFYGDAIITPAISVLSAVEGLKLVTPTFQDYVVPITVVILVALFAVQSHGTGKVGALFGPIMCIWFAVLAVTGLMHIADDPDVFRSLDPRNGLVFFYHHPHVSLAVLGAVCLSVTGAEALYADLGHFGRGPVRSAWLFFVFPSLALNYLGQGALVLAHPEAIENPFYRLVPEWALIPMVALATIAAIIAAQAVITGAFSLTRQAIQLGLLPRLEIRFTSEAHSGQIYMPRVNTLLLFGVLFFVVSFGSSSALSNAYGISVFGAMAVDSLLAIIVIWKGWRWSLWATIALLAPFLLIDMAFFTANLLKLLSGGFAPLFLAAALIVIMLTWRRGTAILFDKTRRTDVPLVELVAMLGKSPPHRVKGTAVFLTSDPETAPAALLHNLKHNKVLHEKNVILTVRSADMPRVSEDERVTIEPIDDTFSRVEMLFGYMETPNVPKGLAALRKRGFKFDIMLTSFFLSRRSIRPAAQSGMPIWQDKLFIGLAKTASDATDFFQIPTGRVVEVGTQVTVEAASPPPFGGEARRGAQHVGFRAEPVEGGHGLVGEPVTLGDRRVEAEKIDQRRLALGLVLGGRLAKRIGIGHPVEDVVGDLEGGTERAAIGRERRTVGLARPPEDGAGLGGEAQHRAGLHRLQHARRLRIDGRHAVAALRRKVEHLPADHAAEAGRLGEPGDERDARARIRIRRRIGEFLEGEGEQPVAGQDRRRLVEGTVDGGAPAPQVVVVHGRQVVMDQRIAVQAFDRAGGGQRLVGRNAEQAGALDGQERAQPLAAPERAVAHGGHQPGRTGDLAGGGIVGEPAAEFSLHRGGMDREQRLERPAGLVLVTCLAHRASPPS